MNTLNKNALITSLAQSIAAGALEVGGNARMLSVWTMMGGDVDLVVAAFRESLSGDDVPATQHPTTDDEVESLMDAHADDLLSLIEDVHAAVREIGRTMLLA